MFLLEFLKHPLRVGAVAPSGRGLARKMMEPVDFHRAEVIVEYGPGTGAFTREILSRKRPETRLILIEQNETFFRELFARCQDKDNTTVLFGSAEEADRLVRELGFTRANAVISGLPFTSLPQGVSLRVFAATRQLIRDDGVFVTFQYSKVKEGLFAQYFQIAKVLRERRNLPPAYVYVLKKKGEVL